MLVVSINRRISVAKPSKEFNQVSTARCLVRKWTWWRGCYHRKLALYFNRFSSATVTESLSTVILFFISSLEVLSVFTAMQHLFHASVSTAFILLLKLLSVFFYVCPSLLILSFCFVVSFFSQWYGSNLHLCWALVDCSSSSNFVQKDFFDKFRLR